MPLSTFDGGCFSRGLSLMSSCNLLCGIIILLVLYSIGWIVWTLFFHPLSGYPGPSLAAITPLVHLLWDIQGKQHSVITSLHDKYGDVVRIAPNALAYRAASGWKEIYGHRKRGGKVFIKDPALYAPTPNRVNAIITAQDEVHQRMRRLLTHAFSNKALMAQEEILQTYADILIEKLQGIMGSTSSQRIDIASWFNFTTFDLIGDLAFGEPFGCLSHSKYHWWVLIILDAVKASAYLKVFWFYPFLVPFVKLLVPRDLIEKREKSFQLSVEKVRRRLARDTSRPDFTSYILKHTKEGLTMSPEEMDANSAVFVLAGSETTAALLSGAIYLLTCNREKYERLIREIRGAFKEHTDIKLTALFDLPYLNAVLLESMRVYPPIPSMLPRIVPEGGAMINDRYVPAKVSLTFLYRRRGWWLSCIMNISVLLCVELLFYPSLLHCMLNILTDPLHVQTSVSMSPYSTFHAADHFKYPDTFIPERWLSETDEFKDDNRAAFQPYSHGPQNCLGQHLANAEMRLILAKVLWNFDIELPVESLPWINQKSFSLWKRPALMVNLLRAGRIC
ncbi:unnamed protein product [Penicillium salamii]|uniref:Cytochrome P450 n=1 Tax=Penicillium salamii TaxID=1612424 RepID=A0A9W4NXC0_9EURO|nr:unnamed protein product [Penicillium salamii]CAG8339846.1 unnamed protein product [Penicillium salamii]CAG8421638.1 unnamed protein product [Penicillium salamii]